MRSNWPSTAGSMVSAIRAYWNLRFIAHEIWKATDSLVWLISLLHTLLESLATTHFSTGTNEPRQW